MNPSLCLPNFLSRCRSDPRPSRRRIPHRTRLSCSQVNWTQTPLPHSETDRWRVPRMGRIQGMTHGRCGEDASALTCLYVHVTRWGFWVTLLKALSVCMVWQTDQNANRSSWGAMYRHKNKTRRRLFFGIPSLIAEGWESRCFQLLGSHEFKRRISSLLI